MPQSVTATAPPAAGARPLRPGLFMISCAARTGSSMLANLLQSHPGVICHMEIFAPARAEGFFGTYRKRLLEETGYQERLSECRRDHPAAYLYKIALDPQGRRSVGFKFKHEEFLLPMFAEARQLIVADRDIRIVRLRRRNLLRRYLSWYVVNHVTGRTLAFTEQERPEYRPVRLDPAACLADIEEANRREATVRAMLRGHPGIDLDYEDLVGPDPVAAHERLLRFLGLEVRALRTVFRKLASDDLRASIANFDELARAFAGTPHAAFLEE